MGAERERTRRGRNYLVAGSFGDERLTQEGGLLAQRPTCNEAVKGARQRGNGEEKEVCHNLTVAYT